jgi:hypothetical protein
MRLFLAHSFVKKMLFLCIPISDWLVQPTLEVALRSLAGLRFVSLPVAEAIFF